MKFLPGSQQLPAVYEKHFPSSVVVGGWPGLLLVSYLRPLTSLAMMQSYGTLAFAFIALVGPVDCHHAHWLVAIVRLGQCMLFGVVVGGGHVQSERETHGNRTLV